ncbi:hypothetical protein Cgig2_015822 [Carnegiea gigantea]|uniref:Uncharacterized protein n=1 Tax=Carnegiea gigantea TaxID=171969 RepID=A0A9Q1QJ19_9CARY|nr:hypothetical protein Cgig2_015822 [Carnegiea gigantea]
MDCVDHALRGAQLHRPTEEVECLKLPLCVFKGRLECSSSSSTRSPESSSPAGSRSLPLEALFVYIMSSSCSSSGDIPKGLTGPQVEGRHPQFSNLPAFIDGRVVVGVPRKNKYREPKKLRYAAPLFKLGTPSWSNCEHSFIPRVLRTNVEVTYPWEITIANYTTDFQVHRMAKTKSTTCIRSPDELLAEGIQGNPCSALSQSNPEVEVASTSSSASSGTARRSPPLSELVLGESSTSSSSSEAPLGPGKSVLKRKGCTLTVTEIVAEESEFPGALPRSDPQDGPGSHFPDPKIVTKLKRSALEKQ